MFNEPKGRLELRADRTRRKALSPVRLIFRIVMLPVVIAAMTTSIYIRTSPMEPEDALRHLFAVAGCREAASVGLAPAYRGEIGYHERNDGDNDGIACERYGSGSVAAMSEETRVAEKIRWAAGAKFIRP